MLMLKRRIINTLSNPIYKTLNVKSKHHLDLEKIGILYDTNDVKKYRERKSLNKFETFLVKFADRVQGL